MAIERTFVGWDAPCLQSVAALLLARSGDRGESDLSSCLVVVPGARAGRRLLEVLVDLTTAANRTLIPPAIVTVGALAERLYRPARPLANDVTRRLAWTAALRATPGDVLARVVPQLPSPDDTRGWLAVADAVERLYAELAGEGVSFEEVATRGEQLERFNDGDRWRALSVVRETYLRTLAEFGECDVHEARRVACAAGTARSDVPIALVAVTDLPKVVRGLLASEECSGTAYVFAPTELADGFEPDGTLSAPHWVDRPIALDDAQITWADRPVDQAAAVIDAVSRLAPDAPAEDIVIGASDAAVVIEIEQQLRRVGIASRPARGPRVLDAAPLSLLRNLGESVASRSFAAAAALVRHPDAFRGLDARDAPGRAGGLTDGPSLFDRHASRHLPHAFAPPWPASAAKHADALTAYWNDWHTVCGELLGHARPLNEWPAQIAAALARAYAGRTFDRANADDRAAVDAFDALRDALEKLASVPPALAVQITSDVAIDLALDALEGAHLTPAPADPAVEILGWLELALDDAPHLIACDMNEGVVPESLSADPFLPNNLRRHLGVTDNERRYARDAYALGAMLASRASVQLVAGRWSAAGDPLSPSRLLLAAQPDVMARRVLEFHAHDNRAPAPDRSIAPIGGADVPPRSRADSASLYAVPRPTRAWPAARPLRVTAFRDYLACPYRFYLRHVERLEAVRDDAIELDARQFGTLAHAALEAFGRDRTIRDSVRADEIRGFLREALAGRARELCGEDPSAIARVQIAQLATRLDAFAEWQAQHVRDGWHIAEVEWELPTALCVIDSPAGSVGVSGRIDRIDVHDRTGERIVYDYKTGARATSPEKQHRRAKAWVDLQLPLYLHMLPIAGIERVTAAGFIVLPAKRAETGELRAEWATDDIEAAITVAQGVVRDVLAAKFWPPADPPPKVGFDELADICQQGQLIATDEADAEP